MRMRSDFYEWLKAFHYYGGVEPKTYGQYLVEKNAKKRGGRKRGKRMIDRIFSKMMDILLEEQINCDRYGYVFNANNYEWRVGRHIAREFELYLSKTGIARRKDEKAVMYGIDVSIDTAATDKIELWRKVGGCEE